MSVGAYDDEVQRTNAHSKSFHDFVLHIRNDEKSLYQVREYTSDN